MTKDRVTAVRKLTQNFEPVTRMTVPAGTGLEIPCLNSPPEGHPYDEIAWETRMVRITNEKGDVIFEQNGVEVPRNWSETATTVVASKYFRGKLGTKDRESSVKGLIDRVVKTITRWGVEGRYFLDDDRDAQTFARELTFLLVHQYAAFNSPVWFNVGVEEKPQCSACFINSVEDSMGSILGLAKTEGMLFKYGSGTGSNLSRIRSSREGLSTGGEASGPVSFMKGFDAFAGVIKSGGRTRRAAKMVILDVDHPDILEFIRCKELEEKKAWALIDAGYDGSFNGEAYASVFFQNSNNSVRVTDEFMRAVIDDKEWRTRAVTTNEVVDTYKARNLMHQISESAWICGDPGLQFHTTINDWHTCANSDRIYASNPCSEYMFLDDTACNLSSLNLLKFRSEDGSFETQRFRHAVQILILAQEILVENASYPTPAIEANSHKYRPLGLGFANLGAYLMASGLPYDSSEGRAVAGAITALMTGEAYKTSAIIAKDRGPFEGYADNAAPMLRVIEKHTAALEDIERSRVPLHLFSAARDSWHEALELGRDFGYKNAQVTVLAPTGTIGFMMDCDTTGIEPDISLVKYKKLTGDGMIKLVNRTVPNSLKNLDYSPREIKEIIDYIDENDTIEGAPNLKDEHLPVFDCAFKPTSGLRSIHYKGHLRMMAACQPFLSGAISKTINCPQEATVEDLQEAYIEAWKLGLKSVAIYRDRCKRAQPLSTSLKKEEPKVPRRRRLPDERQSVTHKFSVAGHEGYITVGVYEDGTPGELFITMAKEGTVVSGLMQAVAQLTSISLQYGVPGHVLVKKLAHTRFEPSGFTNNPKIPMAKSVLDYIFRWFALKFLMNDEVKETSTKPSLVESAGSTRSEEIPQRPNMLTPLPMDAPPCHACGNIMVPNGSCYKCGNCGSTSGCS